MIEDQNIQGIDFTTMTFTDKEFENCIFTNCNFAGANLSGIIFLECEFIDCDLSNAKTGDTAFRTVLFANCKMLGLHFEHCNSFLFAVGFTNCQLNISSFYQVQLKGVHFEKCSLQEADFTEANLSKANFSNCDLASTIFEFTNLESADLSTAYNFNINPENNSVKKAKFSVNGLPGLLQKYQIVIE